MSLRTALAGATTTAIVVAALGNPAVVDAARDSDQQVIASTLAGFVELGRRRRPRRGRGPGRAAPRRADRDGGPAVRAGGALPLAPRRVPGRVGCRRRGRGHGGRRLVRVPGARRPRRRRRRADLLRRPGAGGQRRRGVRPVGRVAGGPGRRPRHAAGGGRRRRPGRPVRDGSRSRTGRYRRPHLRAAPTVVGADPRGRRRSPSRPHRLPARRPGRARRRRAATIPSPRTPPRVRSRPARRRT